MINGNQASGYRPIHVERGGAGHMTEVSGSYPNGFKGSITRKFSHSPADTRPCGVGADSQPPLHLPRVNASQPPGIVSFVTKHSSMEPGTWQGSFGKGRKSHCHHLREEQDFSRPHPNPSFSRGKQLFTLWHNRRLGLAKQVTREGNEAV